MNRKMLPIAGGVALAAFAGALFLYTAHPVRGSDHQDSPTMIARPGADITDVFVFPPPTGGVEQNNNVVLVMNVNPLIPMGQSGSFAFDPAVLYQFKIALGSDTAEDLVIQFKANTSGTAQTLTMYGPAKPNVAGTTSTLVASTGTLGFNTPATLTLNGKQIQVFAGPREDPFFFDLARFFMIIPDRNYQNQPNPPPASASSFRGFPNAGNTTTCDHTASQDFLSSNGFNVLSLVVELPRTLLAPSSGVPGVIKVWATSSTTSGS
jgi:hypothetical protein